MTGYERDLIYQALPRLTESINNLAEKIEKKNNSNDKFYQALDQAGITVEDFTGHIGAILGMNDVDDSEDGKALMKSSWDFLTRLYEIAAKCL